MHNQEKHPGERIVVTGMGAVTPLGLSVAESVDRIMAGEDGIVDITQDILKDFRLARGCRNLICGQTQSWLRL
jgi:3-oxoacyl-(acyl-carrier-protein) synthase